MLTPRVAEGHAWRHADGHARVMLTETPGVMLTTDAVGGVWRYSIELARGFAHGGIKISLVVMGPTPTPMQCDEAAAIPGLELHVTGLPLDWTAPTPVALDAAGGSLVDLAAAIGVMSVQLHTPALLGSAEWGVPVVAAAHSCVATWWRAMRSGHLPPDLAWRAAAMARGLERADMVVAPSASFAAALRACYSLNRSIEVVPNGRTWLSGQAPRRGVVLTAGRLWDEGKGIATLDAAAARLDHRVLAAGPVSGPNAASIATRHLHLMGSLNEPALARAYAEAAVFCSPALYEPFGLAVLEAAQAGCALVLSDIPTFRELWDGAAHFVPARDPDALAHALRTLLDEPALCARQGMSARGRAQAFDPARMAAATWNVHLAAAARKAA